MSGGAARAGRRPTGRPDGQAGVAAQDALMKLGQHRPRFRALLLDQADTGLPVEAQGVGRPSAPAQRGHLVADERLVRRVLHQQLAKLTDEIGVLAKLQLAPDALEDGGPALLLQSVPHPRHPVAADPGQRLAAPEPVRLAQQPGRLCVVAAGGERVRLAAQPAELMHVDRLGSDVEHVALRPAHQPRVVSHGLPERGAEPGHVDRKAVPGLGRRLRVPEPVDEGLDRDQRARRQQEHGQDRPRPGAAKILPPPGRPELNRSEGPEFHDRLASSTARRQVAADTGTGYAEVLRFGDTRHRHFPLVS